MTTERHANALRAFRNQATLYIITDDNLIEVERALAGNPVLEEINYQFSHNRYAHGNFDYLRCNFD